jgi:hypothetical protein
MNSAVEIEIGIDHRVTTGMFDTDADSDPEKTFQVRSRLKFMALVPELKGGRRRAPLSNLRTQIPLELIEKHGITPAEAARQMGIALSAVSKMIDGARLK